MQGRWGFWGLVVLGLGIIAIGVIVMLSQGGSSLGSGGIPEIAGGQTAREAYEVLSPWLAEWHEGAGVVSCATSVARGSRNGDGWTFQVYAPECGRMALVRIQGQDLQVLRESGSLYSLSLLNVDMWHMDSSELLRLWWRNGGQEAWQQPESASLHLRLGMDRDEGPIWQVIVVRGQGNDLAVWEIAADTGKIVGRDGGGLP